MTKNFINISKNLIYKNYVKILFLLRKKNKMSQESLSQKFLKIKDSKLSPEEAYKILKDFNPDIHNNVDVINKPEPGQIYIFFTKDKNMYEDWRADNYAWQNKGSNKGLPTNKPIIFKKMRSGYVPAVIMHKVFLYLN
jgi:hypothetical protein